MQAWGKTLRQKLTFPFTATISEWQTGSLHIGDEVQVYRLVDIDEHYGAIVEVSHQQGVFHLPLCDLAVSDPNSFLYPLIDAYAEWFANR